MSQTGQLLTSAEAGALLGKSARTVQRLVDRGVLVPEMRLSGPTGAYLFRRDAVEALIQAGAA